MTSPKLRFKEFDGSWVNYCLGNISDIKTGPFGSTLHQEDYVERGTPIITVEHLGEVGLTRQNLPLVSDEDKERLKSYSLAEGDIAFSRVGSVDRCAIITDTEKGWLFSGRILRVRPNQKLVYSKNLMYALKTEDAKYRIRSVAVGQTMPSLNTDILRNFNIFLSESIEEQTQIAFFLSQVDEKICQLTKKNKLLNRYKQGMIQKLFSQQIRFKADDGSKFGEWKETTLGQTGKFIGGGTPSKENNAFWEGSIPWISSSDLTEESIFKINITRYISSDGLNQSATKLVPANSILIVSRVGVGKVAITPHEICTSQDFTSLALTDGNAIFFAYLIKSLTPYLLEMNQGTSIKGFVKEDLSNLEISVPCLDEQTKIANFLSAIDQKIEITTQQIEQAKQWKKGLLQQMFV